MPFLLLCFLLDVSKLRCLPDLRGQAQEAIESARTRAEELRELSEEELQALWAIEYTSLHVSPADLVQVDEQLNELGQERWECYHVSDNGQGRTFYFKRNRSNVTAYLKDLLKLGAIAF